MTTETSQSPLARLLTGGVLVLAGALLAFALIPNLVGAQTAEEETTPMPERSWEGRSWHSGGFGGHYAVDVTAEVTGTTSEDVTAALAEGASLASYAADQGVDRDALVGAIVAAMQADLDERVADGSITSERAGELAAGLEEKVEALVDREGLPMRGGPGCNQDDNGEETATDTI